MAAILSLSQSVKDMKRWKTSVSYLCLVHPGVRDKRRVSEIDLSQPRHETAFWWRHNGPVTSQLTDRIKWPNYPVELIGIYVHINTHNKESLTQRCRRSTNVQLCLIFLYISIWFSLNGWHALLCIANNRHDVTITTHAINRHFLIWMTTVRQPTKRRRSCVLTLKYIFICVYWWTRQRIHNTLIVVDRYLRLMGDKTIPDSAEPRLESFYPPFVAGIDLPHQGVVDSYSLFNRLLTCQPSSEATCTLRLSRVYRWPVLISYNHIISRPQGVDFLEAHDDVIGHRWIPLTKASDAELWCFLWSAPEQAVE